MCWYKHRKTWSCILLIYYSSCFLEVGDRKMSVLTLEPRRRCSNALCMLEGHVKVYLAFSLEFTKSLLLCLIWASLKRATDLSRTCSFSCLLPHGDCPHTVKLWQCFSRVVPISWLRGENLQQMICAELPFSAQYVNQALPSGFGCISRHDQPSEHVWRTVLLPWTSLTFLKRQPDYHWVPPSCSFQPSPVRWPDSPMGLGSASQTYYPHWFQPRDGRSSISVAC